MNVEELTDDLRMLELENPGQAYLLRRGDRLILIDSGTAGQAENIAAAIRDWGLDTDALTHVILTHWHPDHVGAAAELRTWPNVKVWAGKADAPVISGDELGSFPDLTASEQAFYEQAVGHVPAADPVIVDREFSGDEIVDELSARIIATPGHTEGSIAVYFPELKILFTGDVATSRDGQVFLGPFDTDRERARESFRRLAEFEVDTVCFGHGSALLGPATTAFTEAVRAATVPDPLA
jgi:glyoxylase-like metal-dependent hydrolase (beta-lactamase superfamily II)